MMTILWIMKFLILSVPVLLMVAFVTLLERKILGLMGLRLGPNKISIQGLLQPVTDAMKLANKSSNNMNQMLFLLYYLAPLTMIFLSLSMWSSINMKQEYIFWKFSFLALMFFMSMLSVKSILTAWSIKTKYPLMGSLRMVSQLISYESVLFLILLSAIALSKSFNMNLMKITMMNNLALEIPLILMIWMPTILAELSRTPYDFSESESELVSGFNTELGSSSFTLIFLSEYMNILLMMALTTMLFFSPKNTMIMTLWTMLMAATTIWLRATLPRLRFDKFMMTAWKFYIPFMTMILIMMMMENM